MIPLSLFVFVLVQSSIANLDDAFADVPEPYVEGFSDGLADAEDQEIEKRSGDFLRFGRSGADRLANDDSGKNKKNVLRKNDNFIRFGRNDNRFLRFGRDQNNRALADGEIYLSFGRRPSVDEKNRRPRRSVDPDEYPKRKDAFLRFGRDHPEGSGRGRETSMPADSPLALLLAEVLARRGAHWHNAP